MKNYNIKKVDKRDESKILLQKGEEKKF